ncbi:MAG TPA: hypothetical protein PL182_13435, partial [Pseudobdellovibrionaceae bacterium]|nr:hypothetical protein [Pseudobdellovibrionaceae bacterium]
NREAARNGPNCWNAALYSRGLVGGIRHVDGYEFTAWLSSPLCKEVPAEQAAGGDIVALRRVTLDGRLVKGPYGAEVHGFLLGSDGIGFTKNGTNAKDIYQLQDAASIFQIYQSVNKRDCRLLGLPKEACQLRAQYFRCQASPPVWSENLRGFEEKISALEKRLHEFYFDASLTREDQNAFRTSVSAQLRTLQKELSAVNASEAPAWQVELLDARLASAGVFLF